MFCKNCGKELLSDEKYCSSCGNSTNSEQIPYANDKTTKKKKNKGKITGIVPGLLLIMFITIIVGFVNLTSTQTNSNPTNVNEDKNSSNNSKGALITLDEFNKIETGMSYKDVVNIIGANGTLSSESSIGNYTTQIYTWYGSVFGANANVTFQNGKVIGKAQAGLH